MAENYLIQSVPGKCNHVAYIELGVNNQKWIVMISFVYIYLSFLITHFYIIYIIYFIMSISAFHSHTLFLHYLVKIHSHITHKNGCVWVVVIHHVTFFMSMLTNLVNFMVPSFSVVCRSRNTVVDVVPSPVFTFNLSHFDIVSDSSNFSTEIFICIVLNHIEPYVLYLLWWYQGQNYSPPHKSSKVIIFTIMCS